MNPTCQHPECHDTRTSSYRPTIANGAAAYPPHIVGTTISAGARPGWHVLCRIHGLLTYNTWAF